MRAIPRRVLYCHASHGIHFSSGFIRNEPNQCTRNDHLLGLPTTPMKRMKRCAGGGKTSISAALTSALEPGPGLSFVSASSDKKRANITCDGDSTCVVAKAVCVSIAIILPSVVRQIARRAAATDAPL